MAGLRGATVGLQSSWVWCSATRDGDSAVPRDTYPGDTAGLDLELHKPAEMKYVARSSFSSPVVSSREDLRFPLDRPGFVHGYLR